MTVTRHMQRSLGPRQPPAGPRSRSKPPPPQDALLRSILEVTVAYHRQLLGIKEEEEAPDVDEYGNRCGARSDQIRSDHIRSDDP